MLLKSSDTEDEEALDDEEDLELEELQEDEEWLHTASIITPRHRFKDRSRVYKPPNYHALERAKQERYKEMKMNAIMKDIFSYLVFLWLLIVISYGNRDPNAYHMKDTLVKMFIESGNYESIRTTADFWKWAKETFMPAVQVGPWYNGYAPLGMRGFLDDRTNRMMGYAVLRQVRIKPQTCSVDDRISPITGQCRHFSKIINEDHMHYRPGWQDPSPEPYVNDTKIYKYLNPSKSLKDEWHYRTQRELEGLPFWGKLDVYSGAGYIISLRGSRESIVHRMDELKSQRWIDARTRAVFAEFSVYNAQVNLFAIVTIIGEFQPGGGVVPNYRIDIFRLMRYHQGFGAFVIFCELSYMAFIIYFAVREFKVGDH